MSWLRVGLASLATSMAVTVPLASAQTFCVRGTADAPGCGAAAQQPTIQAAIDAAAGSAGPDVVLLEGTLPAQGFTIGAGNVVNIDGTDADALTITSSDHIEVHDPDASISHAAFVVQTPAPTVAIDLSAGTLDDVDIAGAYSSEATIRLGDAALDGVQFEDVDNPGTAVNAVGPGGVIERSALVGQHALTSSSDGLAVRNSVLEGRTDSSGGAALSVTRGSATVDDTLILLDQSDFGSGYGVSITPDPGETPDLALRSVTIVGEGSDPDSTPPSSRGVFAGCYHGTTANVSLLDTAVLLFTIDLADLGCGVSLDHVRYGTRVGDVFVDGPSVIGSGWPAGWLGAPIYESSLIDAGSDRSDDADDVAGLPRVVDSDGDGVARRDIGAWEYQRQPPVAMLQDQHVAVGQVAVIDGRASGDPDGGDFGFLTYAWKLDGAPIPYLSDRLQSLQTVFEKPGPHTVSLTVTDPVGFSDTATATVTVDSGPASPTPAPVPRPGPARAPQAPRFTGGVVQPMPFVTARVPPTSAFLLDHRLGKNGKLRVKVTCGGGLKVCRGRVQLCANTGKTTVVLGRSAVVAIGANRGRSVSVSVTAAGRKLLRGHKAKGVRVGVRFYDLSGMSYMNGVGGPVKP